MPDRLPGDTPMGELAAEAQITPADIARAKAAWKKHARRTNLLDAVPIPAPKPRDDAPPR